MSTEVEQQFSRILANIAESLDIPESKYEEAVSRYEAVGKWLDANDSKLHIHKPKIYPQGSFRLGTMVKPVNDGDEYDIDLVCHLEIDKKNVTQQTLKEMVGDRLKAYAPYERILDEGRRCWTLNYANEFHMDILPAIPDYERLNDSILITDKKLKLWQQSNPKGYTRWFHERMKVIFQQRRLAIAESMKANVEQVPEYKVKTPLQIAIQILKRHRDLRFADKPNSEDKPISMIITTLSAMVYGSESDPYTTVINIVNSLTSYESITEQYKSAGGLIEKREGRWYIPNPVDPAENFADRWHENNHAKARAFFQWIKWLQTDISTAFSKQGLNEIAEALIPVMGNQPVKEAMTKMATSYRNAGKSGLLTTAGTGILSVSGTGIKNPKHDFHGPCN